MPDLVVRDVTKEYPTRSGPLVVLRGCAFEMNRGENLAIVGPSGSGKSTLLAILGTLDTPSTGNITIGGQNPFVMADAELARFRHERVGFVFQDHHLLPQCTVLENVLLPTIAGPNGMQSEHVERARNLLERVRLADRFEHRPAELSGGERQRVAIARALINQPLLLLADEPTGNLDRRTATEIGDLLLELQQAEQTMLVIVTHSEELAGRLQRQFLLDDGRLEPHASEKSVA